VQRKQIGRHLKRLAGAGIIAGPVLVDLLEKRYPKYGFLGRQALEMIEAFREETRGRVAPGEYIGSLPTGDANYPSSPLTQDDYSLGQQIDPTVQKDALGGILREIQEREQLLRAEATARGVSEAPR